MTVQTEPSAAVEAVRLVPCGHCWQPRPGEPCTPAGDHFARWARARRKGLITAEQAGAALDLLPVITNAAIVPDAAAGPDPRLWAAAVAEAWQAYEDATGSEL
jgi:hypothetical protein